MGCRADVPELGDRHFQPPLVRLVGGAEWIVAAWLRCHLDVAAEDMRDDTAVGESDHPVQAVEELWEVERVQTAGNHRVTGKQEAGPRVVDGDGSPMMTGAAHDVEHSPA